MAPEALRRRMAHGNIYPPERIDAALGNYFRVGNLTALRELALLWLADSVDEGLQRYRAEHGITGTWETKERVVVALTGGPEGDTLIRRAARIAARPPAANCWPCTSPAATAWPARAWPRWPGSGCCVESLGGTYHSVVGDAVAPALLDFARQRRRDPDRAGRLAPPPAVAALTGRGHRRAPSPGCPATSTSTWWRTTTRPGRARAAAAQRRV